MPLVFFNTYSRSREEFKPLEEGHVRMYTCGPTVYAPAHIGNFRAYVFEDILRRYLKFKGYRVTQVMNLTDVDDKTIRDSRARGVSLNEHTRQFIDIFFRDIDQLNIERAEVYPRATEHIPEMVAMIKSLMAKGHAYESAGSIYYRVSSFPRYGSLSHMKLDQLIEGARVDSDEYAKETASDFALWKAWSEDDGDVYWDTELGRGRPGWHIECSAMSMKYLGRSFDIHTGGVDNIFPHHENEIAQSEAANGVKFVNYWLHCEHLIVEGRKMAKSEGNFFTIQDLVDKGHNPLAIRYLLLATHYRQQLNFTADSLAAAAGAIARMRDFRDSIAEGNGTGLNPEVQAAADNGLREFETAMDDDLNISPALGAVFDFIREINSIKARRRITVEDSAYLQKVLRRIDGVLGVVYVQEQALDSEIEELIRKRQEARRAKNYAESDRIRKILDGMGIILEDTPSGVRWKRKI